MAKYNRPTEPKAARAAPVSEDLEPRSWRGDLARTATGQRQAWLLPSRNWLVRQGYLKACTDPETGRWLGDQITDAGRAVLK